MRDQENIILREASQIKTSIIWYHLHEESKKKYQQIYIQNRNRLTGIKKQTYGYQRGKVAEGDKLEEYGTNRYKVLYIN